MLKDRNLGMGDEEDDITVEAHAAFSAVISSCLLTAFLCHSMLTALGSPTFSCIAGCTSMVMQRQSWMA